MAKTVLTVLEANSNVVDTLSALKVDANFKRLALLTVCRHAWVEAVERRAVTTNRLKAARLLIQDMSATTQATPTTYKQVKTTLTTLNIPHKLAHSYSKTRLA